MSGDDSSTPVVTTRYGVFLTPDPVTCAAVTAVTGFVRAQYGFVSAGAFPPHATLAGSLPVRGGEAALIDALDPVLTDARPVRVQNAGVRELGAVVVYDVSMLDGRRNDALDELARRVHAAVEPLLAPTGGMAADVYDPARFHPHLSLASHDLFDRPDLQHEVAAFAAALPVAFPTEFAGDTVTLHRFEHPTWDGRWWEGMRWSHVRTWRLVPHGPHA